MFKMFKYLKSKILVQRKQPTCICGRIIIGRGPGVCIGDPGGPGGGPDPGGGPPGPGLPAGPGAETGGPLPGPTLPLLFWERTRVLNSSKDRSNSNYLHLDVIQRFLI